MKESETRVRRRSAEGALERSMGTDEEDNDWNRLFEEDITR